MMLVFTFQTVCIASKNTALLFHTFVKSSRKMFRQGVRDINDEFEEQNRKYMDCVVQYHDYSISAIKFNKSSFKNDFCKHVAFRQTSICVRFLITSYSVLLQSKSRK